MSFSFWDIMQVIGALAFFIYGMKVMSDGVQRAAGSQMRSFLRDMTKTQYLGVLTGFFVTSLVQSSSATTVMVVSFVNAGLLTMVESAGVMIGANIGTTITGWLISIFGFELEFHTLSLPIIAIGLILIFAGKGNKKDWGEFLIGFAILFIALNYLKEAIPDISNNAPLFNFLSGYTDSGMLSLIFFLIVGIVFSLMIQSSSAAMVVTQTMCLQGWLPFEAGVAMILGENIGTTFTAEVASWVGTSNARRSARIHLFFNVIGVLWMLPLVPFLLPIISEGLGAILPITDPYLNQGDMPMALAGFHTIFNILNAIILLPFIGFLVKIASMSVKERDEDIEEINIGLKHIGTTLLTPELATVELRKEIHHFGELILRMSTFTNQIINSNEQDQKRINHKKIEKYENITNRIQEEIRDYISKLGSHQITERTSSKLNKFLNISNDLENIADLFLDISKVLQRKEKNKDYFLPDQRNNINEIHGEVENALKEMMNNLRKARFQEVELDSAAIIEKNINKMRKKLRKQTLKKIDKEDYNPRMALIYSEVFSTLEKIGDRVYNVTEIMVDED